MTNASRPHVLCDASNLLVDARHMMAAPCLEHRPNYLCNFGATYHRYLPGAFGLACTSSIVRLDMFPQDHLQDIMGSMKTLTRETASQVIISGSPYAVVNAQYVTQNMSCAICNTQYITFAGMNH